MTDQHDKTPRLTAPAIPPALADLRDILDDVSQVLACIQTMVFDANLTTCEVEAEQTVLRQRLAHHALTYHSGVQLGYAHFATIDGRQFYNAAWQSWQSWKSPGALCTEAEAEIIAAVALKHNETMEQDGIKTPRGWTAFTAKNKET